MSEKRHVLVADDDEDQLSMLKTVLEDWGHEVTTATGGAEVLKLADERSYSLVLMDVGMGARWDGLDILSKLRAGDGPSSRVPIVIISGYTSERHKADAVKRGACGYIEKPVDLDELRIVLDRNLGGKGSGGAPLP
ncbi:MAG: response regulator [Deltaproteobacteria bacterium]|jgi:DNA-binding response OmpR family regulator|nr:response regulator [Deltaproteobacteria bacterium]